MEELIEARIREAVAEGAFDNLKGMGEPLRFRQEDLLAGDNWLGFKVLENGGLLPEWLMLAKEIESDRAALRRLDERHAEAVALAESSGAWAALASTIRERRDAFEAAARALRKKQERFNHDAPSIRLERPAIWVEHHLARLDARVATVSEPS